MKSQDQFQWVLFSQSQHSAPCWLRHPLTCSRWRHRRVPVRGNLAAHGLQSVNEFIAMCFRNNFTPHYCSWLVMLSLFPLSNLHTDDSTCGIAGYSSQESPDNYLHQNSHNSSARLSAAKFLIQRSTNKCNYFRNDSNCRAPSSWGLCRIASRQKEWKMMHLEPCQKAYGAHLLFGFWTWANF